MSDFKSDHGARFNRAVNQRFLKKDDQAETPEPGIISGPTPVMPAASTLHQHSAWDSVRAEFDQRYRSQ